MLASVLLTVALVAAGCTAPASDGGSAPPSGATARPTTTPATTGPTGGSAEMPSPTPTTEPSAYEISAPGRATFLIHGTYPHVRSRCVNHTQPTLTRRFPGTLHAERADDGTWSLTISIPFEDYLKGIAEVPPSWPTAALEAQAIAARSYALASTGWTRDSTTLDNPICSTSSCQVYGGIPLDPASDQGRWYRAVRRTRGEILVYQGRPATTFYFSTSNGHTYGNEDVFGGEALPYLRPVTENDDGASPTSHWAARIPYRDLSRFLHEAGEWPDGTRITDVALDGGTVHVTGEGVARSMELSTFRDAVNTWGPCLEPTRYPPGSLPVTIPSSWLELATTHGSVFVTGRGWGHGVGMVQWGAYGKAREGWSASDILASYYGGFRPQSYPEPGVIEVQVADGLTSLRIRASRPGVVVNLEPIEGTRVAIGP